MLRRLLLGIRDFGIRLHERSNTVNNHCKIVEVRSLLWWRITQYNKPPLLPYGVTVAQEALTLLVWVQILVGRQYSFILLKNIINKITWN